MQVGIKECELRGMVLSSLPGKFLVECWYSTLLFCSGHIGSVAGQFSESFASPRCSILQVACSELDFEM